MKKSTKVNIHDIKSNESNPRWIKDTKFKKLVKSINEFPEMLELRPIVVDEDMIILGGNMRHKACIEAGLQEVPITIAKGLTEKQKREFIIKDNVGFGEWDWDNLAENWNNTHIKDWGLVVWNGDDMFELEDTKEEQEPKASIMDDGYSQFEMIMVHQNKLELIRVLNEIKEKNNLEKQEDALMVLVDYGKRSI
jgi:hypothetical protein